MADVVGRRRVALLSLHSSPLAVLGSTDAGGMNLYVRRLADGLAELGIEADVFTRRTDPSSPAILVQESGARVIHLDAGPARPLPKSGLPYRIPAMAAALDSFICASGQEYDLAHSHYWLSGMVSLRARSLGGAPRVHMFHTLARVKEFYLRRADPTDSLTRVDGEQEVIGGMDAIVGATEAEREYMERLYLTAPRRFAVIPPGVDLDCFRPRERMECREALGIRGRRVVLFVGRLNPIKGLDILLRSAGEVANHVEGLELIVVGDPEEDGRSGQARYQRLADQLGLRGLVAFHGSVPQDQLAMYYSAADVCAMPSTYESFGMVAVESMACETPVVAFGVGGLKTTIRHGETGFLARPGDARDFTRMLRAALESDDLPAMGRRARESVEGYSWNLIVRRTLQLYRSLMSDRVRAGAALQRV